MTIKDKLRDINQDEVWSSDRIEKTEAFIKEFTIGFVRFLYVQKEDFPEIYFSKTNDQLLEIYIETL